MKTQILTIIGKVGAVLKDHDRRKLWQSYRLLKTHKIFEVRRTLHKTLLLCEMWLNVSSAEIRSKLGILCRFA